MEHLALFEQSNVAILKTKDFIIQAFQESTLLF